MKELLLEMYIACNERIARDERMKTLIEMRLDEIQKEEQEAAKNGK